MLHLPRMLINLLYENLVQNCIFYRSSCSTISQPILNFCLRSSSYINKHDKLALLRFLACPKFLECYISYMLQNKQRLSMFLKLGFKQTYRNNTNISCNTTLVCASPATHIYLQRKVNNVCFSNRATPPSSLQVISFVLLCPHIKAFQVISSVPTSRSFCSQTFSCVSLSCALCLSFQVISV